MIPKVLLALATVATSLVAEPEAKTFTATDGTEILYRFAIPEKTENGKTYPLVLFLHGSGQRGNDNKAQLSRAKSILKTAAEINQTTYLIAPQCPPGQWWAEASEGWRQLADAGGENPLMEAILTLVEETAKTHPIDRNRIYLTGLSMGGFGTFDMLARSPETWAAAIPICGGGDPKSAEKFKNLPIRIFHGDADTVVAPTASILMHDALKEAGSSAELTLYPGVGHNSWTQTYSNPEVIKWLFSQRKPD